MEYGIVQGTEKFEFVGEILIPHDNGTKALGQGVNPIEIGIKLYHGTYASNPDLSPIRSNLKRKFQATASAVKRIKQHTPLCRRSTN